MSKICLVMIVKNEAAVLDRCLTSVKDFCDYAMVVDTGSTTEQFDIMGDYLDDNFDKSFNFIQRVWSDFATNRTEALYEAGKRFPDANYFLVMDADDVFVRDCKELELLELKDDCYHIEIRYNEIRYTRAQLFKAGLDWHYRGVVHEFAECGTIFPSSSLLPGAYIEVHKEGSRSKDPDLYLKDAKLLSDTLKNLPVEDVDLRPRYTFYCAQSYRDAGDYTNANYFYRQRLNLVGWKEESYISCYELIKIELLTTKCGPDISYWCKRSIEFSPDRNETIVLMARIFRAAERYEDALTLLRQHPVTSFSTAWLFGVPSVYEWEHHDEVAINAYYCGYYLESATAALAAIKGNMGKTLDLPRLVVNLEFALKKL